MKTIFVIFAVLLITLLGTISCDKIENAYPPKFDIDTTLYPGNWDDYMANEYPVFGTNPNTQQNVLIEEYTGHLCNNCPTAAELAHNIKYSNPSRIFVAAIHAGPSNNGITSFQSLSSDPTKFQTDHTNPSGLAYGAYFQSGFNFFGNPQGTVNRKTVDGKMFDFTGTWQTRVTNILNENDPKVLVQSIFNYFPQSNGGFLHIETEKIKSVEEQLNVVVYIVQDSLVDWQLMPNNTYNENYTHYDKHLGNINGLTWGEQVFTANQSVGTKTVKDYSFSVPNGYDAEELYFLIYVYNRSTYEIYQVIQQRLTE